MALNQGPQPYFSSPFYEANFKVKAEKRARRGRGRDVTVVAVGRTLAAVVIPGLIFPGGRCADGARYALSVFLSFERATDRFLESKGQFVERERERESVSVSLNLWVTGEG